MMGPPYRRILAGDATIITGAVFKAHTVDPDNKLKSISQEGQIDFPLPKPYCALTIVRTSASATPTSVISEGDTVSFEFETSGPFKQIYAPGIGVFETGNYDILHYVMKAGTVTPTIKRDPTTNAITACSNKYTISAWADSLDGSRISCGTNVYFDTDPAAFNTPACVNARLGLNPDGTPKDPAGPPDDDDGIVEPPATINQAACHGNRGGTNSSGQGYNMRPLGYRSGRGCCWEQSVGNMWSRSFCDR
jgi:hypothetical protein